jgi:predicted dehydrogenase
LKKKICIIGIGNRPLPKNFSSSNWDGWIKNIYSTNLFQIVSIADPDQNQLNRASKSKYLTNVKTYKNARQMLNSEKVDAALICSPAKYHFEDIMNCLKKNIFILVEKPCVSNTVEAKKIINTGKANKISVIQNWRFKDNSLEIKKKLDNKSIGKIGQVFFRYLRNREKINYSKYIYTEKYPALYSMGSHHIDMIRYLLNDEIIKVNAISHKPNWSKYKFDTTQNISMMTKNKVLINYLTTFSSKNETIPQESFILEGSKGYIYNDSDWFEPPVFLFKNGKTTNITKSIKKKYCSIKIQNDRSDVRILKNFYKFVNNKKSNHTSFKDAVKSIFIIENIIKSFKQKKEIKIKKI